MKVTTRAQREAMFRLYQRGNSKVTYREFRKECRQCFGDYIGVHWMGIFFGIETDGYTHT